MRIRITRQLKWKLFKKRPLERRNILSVTQIKWVPSWTAPPWRVDPLLLIERMLIVAHVIGIADDFIDPRAEYLFALKRLHALARACPAYWEKTFGRRYRS
jgi:hypothetical protein